jgi:hypothetical protein
MKTIFKVLLVTGLVAATALTVTLSSVKAASVYDEIKPTELSLTVDTSKAYSLEEMLNYALQDEYMAQAEYQAIIEEFGDVRPFTNIVNAEQNHIDLLLPLFAEYGINVPVNESAASVVVPDSITSALSTGVDAENANIAMYQAFLAQDNLPDNVRQAFEYLQNASQSHLQAFSQDRYSYYGSDMMNQIRNQFQKAFRGSNENSSQNQMQYKYQGANGQGQGSKGQGGQGLRLQDNSLNGECPNS